MKTLFNLLSSFEELTNIEKTNKIFFEKNLNFFLTFSKKYNKPNLKIAAYIPQ